MSRLSARQMAHGSIPRCRWRPMHRCQPARPREARDAPADRSTGAGRPCCLHPAPVARSCSCPWPTTPSGDRVRDGPPAVGRDAPGQTVRRSCALAVMLATTRPRALDIASTGGSWKRSSDTGGWKGCLARTVDDGPGSGERSAPVPVPGRAGSGRAVRPEARRAWLCAGRGIRRHDSGSIEPRETSTVRMSAPPRAFFRSARRDCCGMGWSRQRLARGVWRKHNHRLIQDPYYRNLLGQRLCDQLRGCCRCDRTAE